MKKFILNDHIYEILKWFFLIVTPAFMTLLTTLGKIWGLDVTNIVLTIGAIATFGGAVLGISNHNYYKDNNDIDNYNQF